MIDEILNPYKKYSKKNETEENKKQEIRINILIKNLVPFKSQPFNEYSEDEMKELKESIERIGLQNPVIVRPINDEKYEILAGHNRVQAFKELGKEQIPVVIKDVDDDTAQMIMIDTNIVQRQKLTPMERAKAYKLKDEIKKRRKYNIDKVDETLSEEEKRVLGESVAKQTYYRYLSLNNLIPEYQVKCDVGKLPIKAAEQLAKLNTEQQRKIYESLGESNISEKKAIELKEFATTTNDFSIENIKECFSGNKNINKSTIKFTKKEMERYFNGFTSIEEIKEYIISFLEEKNEKMEESTMRENYY